MIWLDEEKIRRGLGAQVTHSGGISTARRSRRGAGHEGLGIALNAHEGELNALRIGAFKRDKMAKIPYVREVATLGGLAAAYFLLLPVVRNMLSNSGANGSF